MEYIYLMLVVGIIVFIIFRIFKKRSLPSNRYTLYDEITQQDIKVNIKESEDNEEKQ